MGFPPGVAEELVIKVLRTCDPKNKKSPNGARKPIDINNEIMCSTVAREVEVTEEIYPDEYEDPSISDHQYAAPPPPTEIKTETLDTNIPAEDSTKPNTIKAKDQPSVIPEDYKPPVIPTQKNSETYNGAERDIYSWSQNIMELGM